MKEKLTAYLRSLSHIPGIANQYILHPEEQLTKEYSDPLMEDSHEKVKGLIHKYKNRALIKVSYQCAAHCRFCTRIRQIGNPEGTLTEENLAKIIEYLEQHPEIEDVILSGGDPFLSPKITESLLAKLNKLDSVKVIRIGTRLPLQSPKSFNSKAVVKLLSTIKEIAFQKPFYILLHAEHPDELTEEALEAIKTIRQNSGASLLSQSVFLKGINIDFDTLLSLFKKLYFAGVTPYYIYHCDHVHGLEHFVGNIEEELAIMRRLRQELSGIAYPTFIADLENDYGKFPFDLNMISFLGNEVIRV